MTDLNKRFRAILPLGKFRVIERSDKHIKVEMGGSTTMTIMMNTDMYDIRVGDLLTYYTQVLFKEPTTNAQPQ